MLPLLLNPVIPTRWPIKSIDCGGVLTSGFINPDTPSDIGKGRQMVETWDTDWYPCFPGGTVGQAHLGSEICNEAGDLTLVSPVWDGFSPSG